jgi:Rieske Fe-S protein
MTPESRQDQAATRRRVLLGAGALGAVGVLSACSTAAVPYDANDAGQAPGTGLTVPPASTDTQVPAAAATRPSESAGHSQETGILLGLASEVPIGGGLVYTAAKVVVTQPTKGTYKAFSAVCTHVGCVCNQVATGTIDCPCHGSKFKIADGSVVTGPASSPLAAKIIAVTDGKVFLQ